MLKSRTVADRLIERFDLIRVYDEDLLYYARKELDRNTSITAGRDGVIKIEVEDKDPQRAADLANSYVEQLRVLTGELALSEASQRRLLFETQLKKAKNDLATAEVELRKFAEEKGLINPEGQISLSVSAAAMLRAQITAKEVELTARRSFATDSNPELRRAQEELNGLRMEMAKLEKNAAAGKGDALVPFGKAPGVGLEYIRRFREVKYFETLFEILAKQYEIARIDESKDAPVVQVLESAVKPERRSSPKRLVIAIAGFVLATVVAFVAAVATEALRRSSNDPKRRSQLSELRELLSLRRRS
jgi:capsule polysaccharide export protein KpsE/RkpR